MELESKVKGLGEIKTFKNKEDANSISPKEYAGRGYKGVQIALAQDSVDYCGDGIGDGCKGDN